MPEEPEELQQDETPKSDRRFLWLTLGSAIYVAGMFLIVFCLPSIPNAIETNNGNAFGDFLAGVFAPLAFVWLAVAVLIQREELKSSRENFKKSQNVINKQLAYIEDQNEKAQAVALRDYKLALFDPRIEIYKQLLAFEIGGSMEPVVLFGKHRAMLDIKSRSKFLFGDDVEKWLLDVGEMIWALFIAKQIKKGAAFDADGNYPEGTPYKNEEHLDKAFSQNLGIIVNLLNYDTVNKNLLPYLKVYED